MICASCGRENPGPNGRWFPSAWRDGVDAFFGVNLQAVGGEGARGEETAAELLTRIAGQTKAEGDRITLVPLGPWTNLADAADLDPAFATNLAGIHTMGGTIDSHAVFISAVMSSSVGTPLTGAVTFTGSGASPTKLYCSFHCRTMNTVRLAAG